MVAALDHSEVVAPEIAGSVEAFIANLVPDVRSLLDHMLAGAIPCASRPDPDRIAIVGHSAGGWTALAFPESDARIRAAVALTQAGNCPLHELHSRTPGHKQMVAIPRADHLHFMDNVEQAHEQLRAASLPPEASWISRQMRPLAELCTESHAALSRRAATTSRLSPK
jgi:predicted dienelactone hydrolase